jgi:hypothetical protein
MLYFITIQLETLDLGWVQGPSLVIPVTWEEEIRRIKV